MFKSLLKVVVGVVVETPIAVVADMVTLGGLNTGKNKSYTSEAISKVVKNAQDTTK